MCSFVFFRIYWKFLKFDTIFYLALSHISIVTENDWQLVQYFFLWSVVSFMVFPYIVYFNM